MKKLLMILSLVTCSFPFVNAEIMGIDESGTTEYSDWYGRIVGLLPLNDETWPSIVHVNSDQNISIIVHNSTIKSSLLTLMFNPLSKHLNILTPQNLRRIIHVEDTSVENVYYFVSARESATDIIKYNLATNKVIDSTRVPWVLESPIVVDAHENCLYSCIQENAHALIKVDLLEKSYECYFISQISSDITAICSPMDSLSLYVTSFDNPGDVVKIDKQSMVIIDSITLPSQLKCKNAVCYGEFLVVNADIGYPSPNQLITIELESFSTAQITTLNPGESQVHIMGVYDDIVYLIKKNDQPSIITYSLPELVRENAVLCNDSFEYISSFGMDSDNILIADNSEPMKVESFFREPMTSSGIVYMAENEKSPQCMIYNAILDEVVLSDSSDTPTLIRIEPSAFEFVGKVEFSSAGTGKIELLAVLDDTQYSVALIDHNPKTVVQFFNETYTVESFLDLENGFSPVAIVGGGNGVLIISSGSEAKTYNTTPLSSFGSYVYDHADSEVTSIVYNPVVDCFITGNSLGKIVKYSTNPIAKIDELNLSSVPRSISTITIGHNLNQAYFFLESQPPTAGTVVCVDLDSFEVVSSLDLDSPFFLSRKMLVNPDAMTLSVGASYVIGGIAVVDLSDFSFQAMYGIGKMDNALGNGVLCQENNLSFWTNSRNSGLLTKQCMGRKGYIEGVKCNLTAPANLIRLKLYSHSNEGQLRVAIYDDELN
ncbi:hypothetical protein K8T06_05395, partial [bacterium]|nr:hypothetical protein [bacterium]